jgi:hypothetical protein
MFRMRARLSVPGPVAALREQLAELEAETNLDIRLTPAAPEAAGD